MFPDFNMMPSPSIQRQLDQVAQDKQKLVKAAEIQQLSTAEYIAKHIYDEIVKYQFNLSDKDDVALMLVQFNQSTTILVTNIGYIGNNLICFFGRGTDGKPLELIQHIHQLNFLLTVAPKPVPNEPKRKIGFRGQVEE